MASIKTNKTVSYTLTLTQEEMNTVYRALQQVDDSTVQGCYKLWLWLKSQDIHHQ